MKDAYNNAIRPRSELVGPDPALRWIGTASEVLLLIGLLCVFILFASYAIATRKFYPTSTHKTK